jgi:transcriptional regulator with XRE-family HTH domain
VRAADPERVARAVGRRVAELRAERGWTQEAFAESLGVSIQYLRRVELAQTNVTLSQLVRLANGLRVPASALFDAPASLVVRRGRPAR